MKESPAGIIQKYVLSWIKYYENPIFLRNGIKFIPKGYHNCQLSIVNCQFAKFQSPALLRETALPKSRWPPPENVRRNRALHKNEERISIPTFRHIFPGYLRRNAPCHRGFGGFQIPPYEMNKNPPGGMGKIK